MSKIIAAVLLAVSATASAAPVVRVAVRQAGQWGFIDGTGAVVIPFQHATAGEFRDGIGCLGGQYIDASGKRGEPAVRLVSEP